MYVTTFYSFKGGVGRTMALVNVAVSLALRGRRVLVVDFDVEAPGLDTFDVLRPRAEVPGVIDFVTQYLAEGQAPAAESFIGECPAVGDQGGGLWIMPSGRHETYAATFNQVDWGALYERHDGFLLFEDLKEQWRRIVQPDYVLIDSRTGHTDTSGICTRQLPDSVVVLFFPNEQNLRGLTKVVRDIRSEAGEPRKKSIELHFVMSNVPDLDDEDRILENKIEAFQAQLGFRRDPLVVHRYDSLSLLNQVVFAKDRPRSRLAHEYAEIVQEITVRNWADRDGALDYLRRVSRDPRRMDHESTLTGEEMLERIQAAHSRDGEVLFRLGEHGEDVGRTEWAASLVNQAIDVGYDRPHAYLKRARMRADGKDRDGASEDARRILEFENVVPPMIREAMQWLGACAPAEFVGLPAVRTLEPEYKVRLAMACNLSVEELLIAIELLEQVLHEHDMSESNRRQARQALGLSYMGLGRCADAAGMFRREGERIADLNGQSAFNYGMAMWGTTGTPDVEAFERVVELDPSERPEYESPNYLQCMGIAHWAVGDRDTATQYVERAQRAVRALRGTTHVTCWRYLRVSSELFESDLGEIRALIEKDGSHMPRFVGAATTDTAAPAGCRRTGPPAESEGTAAGGPAGALPRNRRQ